MEEFLEKLQLIDQALTQISLDIKIINKNIEKINSMLSKNI